MIVLKKGYMYPPTQQKLLDDTKSVATKLNKLNDFMRTEEFFNLSREYKDLLYEQQRVMSQYVQILGKRLEMHFSKEILKDELSNIWNGDF